MSIILQDISFFAKNDFILIKGDWTSRSEDISSYLNGLGRSGVPVYVFLLPPLCEPVLLPELLTETILTDTYYKLKGGM